MKISKLAWLAGIIDGEGVIGFYEIHQKGRRKPTYQVHVKIINSDPDIISECSSIMGELASRPVVHTRDARKNRPNIYWHVSVDHQQDVVKVLSAIEPYLIGKKGQAHLLVEMLKKHHKGTPMTKMEREVVGILKRMKREKMIPTEGNAELSRKLKGFRACVENKRATTQIHKPNNIVQSEMNLS